MRWSLAGTRCLAPIPRGLGDGVGDGGHGLTQVTAGVHCRLHLAFKFQSFLGHNGQCLSRFSRNLNSRFSCQIESRDDSSICPIFILPVPCPRKVLFQLN